MKNIFVALAMFAGATTMSAQTQVAEFVPGATANGLNYALPRTAIKADVHAMRTTYTPGQYARFAKRFLHIDNVPQEPSTQWSVVSIDFRTEGEPDTLKYFTMKLNGKSPAPYVQMSKKGLLLAVNTNTEETEVALPADSKSEPPTDGRQYLTEEILMATSVSKMAELIANEIMTIRESKNEIKRGQVESMPKDGASLKIVLDELDKQEAALTRLFTGHTDTLRTSRTYTYIPTGDAASDIFFRFSRKLGFVDADDLVGEPFYISITDKHTVVLPTEKELAKRRLEGLVYNMPSIAAVEVRTLDNTIYRRDIPIAQFGTTDQLSPALFSKGMATKVTLDPATGGILKLEQ